MARIIPYIMENKKCLKPPTSYMLLYKYIPITPNVNQVLCVNAQWLSTTLLHRVACHGLQHSGTAATCDQRRTIGKFTKKNFDSPKKNHYD